MNRLAPSARQLASILALAFGLALSPAALAQDDAAAESFVQFAPKPDRQATSIDYSVWDDALKYMVFRMGRSSREAAATPEASTGSRKTWGHTSRYRLEGNRVIFSFLERDIIDSLTAYKQDLELTADKVDIAALPRNEQLAFWINLHNAAVIEQLAQEYPVRSPSLARFGPDEVPLDEAKVITIRGVAMSPRDIREKIVFPNWRDPKVIYGFFRGEIGGPSIQAEAYTARNVSRLLEDGARDFVNSLRAVEKRGSTMHVSTLYKEAAPFYFPSWESDLRAHLERYSREDVAGILEATDRSEASLYETDIADLANGQREPTLTYVLEDTGDGPEPTGVRVPRSIARLVLEQRRKINELIRRKELTPRVIVIDMQNPENKEGYVVE